MLEIFIFIIISAIIVILVELLTYIRKSKKWDLEKNTSKKKNILRESGKPLVSVMNDTILLNKYSTDSDIVIDHLPGKFYIENSNNIFIKIENRIIIPDNNIVYDIDEKFSLDIINLKNSSINYFYKKT